MTRKCSYIGCYETAIWISVVEEGARAKLYLPTRGTYFYCEKHKKQLSEITDMKFASLESKPEAEPEPKEKK
jgi:hypothetical protein